MAGPLRTITLSVLFAGASLILAGCCPLGPGAAAAAPRIRWAELPSWSMSRYRPSPVTADPDLPANWPEARWNRYLAKRMHAQSEVKTPDGSRADLVTTAADGTRTAWEIDFARKWNQAIGQSLFYAAALGGQPGIVLLLRGSSDRRFYLRCLVVCAKHNIRLRVIDVERSRPVTERGSDGHSRPRS